jgi:hypothetical protein
MAKSIKHINLFILCGLCIAALVIVYLIKPRDSFKDIPVPEFCGTDGYRPVSPAYVKFMKAMNLGDLSTLGRFYDKTDCDRLGGISIAETYCVTLKDTTKMPNGQYKLDSENLERNYGDVCKGLNATSINISAKCKVDDKLTGKQLTGFSLGAKKPVFPDNALRVYTEDECKELGGTIQGLSAFVQQLVGTGVNSKTITDGLVPQLVDADGKEAYFMCNGTGIQFSTVCIDELTVPSVSTITSAISAGNTSTLFQDIGKTLKSHVNTWLNT